MTVSLPGLFLLAQQMPIPLLLGILTCGGLTGVGSMFVYARLSPQERIGELCRQAAAARAEVQRFDGSDPREMFALASQALGLSLRHIGLIVLPTLAAVVLVLVAAWWANELLPLGATFAAPRGWPDWLCSGHTAYWMPLCVTAMLVKWWFRIK